MNSYLWFDPAAEDVSEAMAGYLWQWLSPNKEPLVILCIGTPNFPGDCCGPRTGSLLKTLGIPRFYIYGTMETPIHALNLQTALKSINRRFKRPRILVIDAALGNTSQAGFIAIKKGPLRPGRGLGKRLPAVGHLQIAGVFEVLNTPEAQRLSESYSRCIAQAIQQLYLQMYEAIPPKNDLYKAF